MKCPVCKVVTVEDTCDDCAVPTVAEDFVVVEAEKPKGKGK